MVVNLQSFNSRDNLIISVRFFLCTTSSTAFPAEQVHVGRAGLTSREARGRFSVRGPQHPPPPLLRYKKI